MEFEKHLTANRDYLDYSYSKKKFLFLVKWNRPSGGVIIDCTNNHLEIEKIVKKVQFY